MVVIGTWLITESFLLCCNFEFCAILFPRWIGSNWDLVNYRVPFAFHHVSSYPQMIQILDFKNSNFRNFASVLGRVVIGSLLVYQSIGAGSIPVASTTVLTVSARSIGNDQKSCIRYAWEGLERSGPFPIQIIWAKPTHPYARCGQPRRCCLM